MLIEGGGGSDMHENCASHAINNTLISLSAGRISQRAKTLQIIHLFINLQIVDPWTLLSHHLTYAPNNTLLVASNMWQKHRPPITIARSLNNIYLPQICQAFFPGGDTINSWCGWRLVTFVTFQLPQRNIGVTILICIFTQGIVNVQSISVYRRHFAHKLAVNKWW